MNKPRNLIILLIVLNSLIIVAVPSGHGYGILAVFDWLSVSSLFTSEVASGEADPWFLQLLRAGGISLAAKILLVISLFISNIKLKNALRIIGLLSLMLVFVLIVNLMWGETGMLLLAAIFGLPSALVAFRALQLTI